MLPFLYNASDHKKKGLIAYPDSDGLDQYAQLRSVGLRMESYNCGLFHLWISSEPLFQKGSQTNFITEWQTVQILMRRLIRIYTVCKILFSPWRLQGWKINLVNDRYTSYFWESFIIESRREKTYILTSAPNEDSNQSAHPRSDQSSLSAWRNVASLHYENTPNQIYWKFYNQKRKIFR